MMRKCLPENVKVMIDSKEVTSVSQIKRVFDPEMLAWLRPGKYRNVIKGKLIDITVTRG